MIKNKKYSYDDIYVSTLNEPQNVNLTTENRNRKPRSRKIKRTLPSEWRRNKTKLLRNTGHANWNFKKCAEISERKLCHPCGATGGQKCFISSPSGKGLIFSTGIGLWEISVPKEFWVCVNFTASKIRKSLKLLQTVQPKRAYFDFAIDWNLNNLSIYPSKCSQPLEDQGND